MADGQIETGRTFGARLREFRLAGGLSLAGLAAKTFYSKGYLSKIESGAKPPTRDLAVRCDEVLDTAGALAELVETARPRPATAATRPAQLPPPPTNFTGRTAAIRLLDDVVLARRDGPTEVPVVVICGMGGCGKTALAVWWAHRAAVRFPDGVLFADLHGFGPLSRPAEAHGVGPDPGPTSPEVVLAGFLAALGVPPVGTTASTGALAAEYRTALHGRRMLVVLDNAASAQQVRPLIPGSPSCAVLVTSRSRLPGLVQRDGAASIRVPPFTPAESTALLAKIAGREQPEALRIAELCGHLPLALRVAAERLAQAPEVDIENRLAGLVDHRTRLDALGSTDPESDVRAVLGWSLDALPAPTQRLISLVARYCHGVVTAPGAAVLAGHDLSRSRAMLADLADLHLLEVGPGGYRLHDLIRLYAVERGAPEPAAVERLGWWYVVHLRRAARLATPTLSLLDLPEAGPATVADAPPAPFHDAGTAMAWLDQERTTVLHLVADCAATRTPDAEAPAGRVHAAREQQAWLLVDALRGYCYQRRLVADWVRAARVGLAAAERRGEARAQAAMIASLALAAAARGDYRRAERLNRSALALARTERWDIGIALLNNNLGGVLLVTGRLDDARGAFEQALERNRAAGNAIGEAVSLGNLGGIHRVLADWDEALRCYGAALAIHTRFGARDSAALMHVNQSQLYRQLGQTDEAYLEARRALLGYRATGSRAGQCLAELAVAAALYVRGAFGTARAGATRAYERAVEIGDRRVAADALNLLGTIAARDGRAAESARDHRKALRLSRRSGYDDGVREARSGLAAIRHS